MMKNNNKKKKLLCPGCETGRKDYELDRKSVFCAHIACLSNGVCSKYIPLPGSERR